MPISSQLYAGRYNAYDLAANEVLWQERPFACGDYQNIITQMRTIRPSGSTTGQLLTKWLDSNNRTITTQTISIPVSNRWGRFSFVFDVPANAVACVQAVAGGSAGFTFACAMTDVGDVLRAFSYDLSGITSYLGPEGLYTGQIFANQVNIVNASGQIVGTLDARLLELVSQTEEYSGVQISANGGFVCRGMLGGKQVQVTLNSSSGLAIAVDGVVVGGLSIVDGEVTTLSETLANPKNGKIWWRVGEDGESARAALAGYAKQTISGVERILNFLNVRTVGNIATVLTAPGRESISAVDGMGMLTLQNGRAKIDLNSLMKTATLALADSSGTNLSFISAEETQAIMRFKTGTGRWNSIGVDGTGVFKQIGTNPKVYL